MNKEAHIGSSFNMCLHAGTTLFLFFAFICFKLPAQTYQSRDAHTGLAMYSTSWDGSYPTIVGNDPVMQNGTVHVYGYLINGYAADPANATFTGQGTSLIVEDTLRVFGDLSLFNHASITIKPTGVLIVHGNYWQDANVNFRIEGNAIFLSNWQSADNPVNSSNAGGMYVNGNFTALGSQFLPLRYSQLQIDNPSLYHFSKNTPIASECAGNNSGTINLTDPHSGVLNWQSSTDFFQNQMTTISNSNTSHSYLNLTKTTSYRASYTTDDGGVVYSDAVTIVVRDFMDGNRHAAARAEVPVTNMLASYSLDGHANDGSGNANHGTILGGATLVQDRFGLAGKAYAFDGVDDYIYTTTQYPAPGPQLFSVSIWFKTTTTTGGRLIGFGDQQIIESDKRERHLYMSNSGQLFFGVYPNKTFGIVSTIDSYNDGQWHQAVVSLSSDGLSLFVDGALKATDVTITGAEGYAGYWKIGFDWLNTWPSEPASRYFKGSLDDISIFNKGISPGEAEKLYQAGIAAAPLCEGESLQLMAATKNGATYEWTGPAGFTSTEQNPLIAAVTTANAGQYTVAISFEGCVSRGTTEAVVNPPAQGGRLSGEATVCFAENNGSIYLNDYVGDIIRWEHSADNFQTFEPVVLSSAELKYTNLMTTTSYRAVVENADCPGEVYSTVATIIVNPPVLEGANAVFTGAFPEDSLVGAYPFDGNAWDVSGNENHGSIIGVVAVQDRFGVERSAFSFDGIDDKIFTATQYPAPGPQVYSISLWFKTTETTGGRLIGYSSSQTDWSNNFDRHIYMDDLGHVYFGIFGEGSYRTVKTAQRYNDGQWHQVIASLSAEGLKLYVDGLLMDSNPYNSSGGEAFSGYWRLGGDSMGGKWPGEPTHPYFEGMLDEVFIYERALTETEISQSFSAGEECVCEGETLALEAPSVSGANYAWTGPANFASTEQNPLISDIPLAAAGTYTVAINVDGCQTQLLKHINIVPAAVGGTMASTSEQLCLDNNSGLLSLSGYTGNIVRWESSTDTFATDTTHIAHTTAEYAFNNLAQTTTYRAILSNGSELCSEVYSSPITLFVDPPTVGGVAISSADNLCAGSNSGIISLNGQVGEIIRWESSTDNFTSIIDTIAQTTSEIHFQNLGETSAYRAVVKSGFCNEEISTAVVVNIDETSLGGTLSGSTEVCGGSNSGTLSLSGHRGEVLAWESAPEADFSTITTIAQSANGNTLVPKLLFENITATTYYRAVIKNGNCSLTYSSVAEVTVSTLAGGELAGNETVCEGSNSGTLSLNNYSGNIIRWESSADGFVTDVTPIEFTDAVYIYENQPDTISYRAVIGNGGICAEVYSSVAIINVQTLPVAGTVEGSTTVCAGENSGTVELTDFQGAIIRWESSVDSFKNHIERIPATTLEIAYQNISQTTSYRAVVGNASCGEFFAAEATVLVVDAPQGGVLTGGGRILAGNNSGTLLLEEFRGEILQWEVSADQFNADIRILDHRQENLSYEKLEANIWYRVLIGSPSCSPVYSQPAELSLNKSPIAVTDEFVVPFGLPFSSPKSLLENDSDPEGDLLRIEAQIDVLTAAGNTVTISTDGYFTFESATGFSGTDSFHYQLCDSVGVASACTSGTVMLEVEEEKEQLDQEIIIYQGFSPNNGDYKNNLWIIKNIENHPDNHVQVYNRYGVMVFEMKGYNNADKVFDGFSNRGTGIGVRELPQDTYYYQIRLDENSAGLTGFVVINR